MSIAKNRIIIGRMPLIEAIKSGKNIDKILMQKNATGDVIIDIKKLGREFQIPIQLVPVEKLNGYTQANHQGIIAFTSLVSYLNLQQVIDFVVDKGQTPLFLMLDGITDVRNIGAIARTAVCCGAQAIIIPDKGVGALNEEAMKSSAGALEHINICRVTSLMKAIDELHLNGIKVFVSEMKVATKINEIDFTYPSCIVMGSEDKGVYPAIIKICDEMFHIPMPGKFESLNVSVATGMILYEALSQRSKGN
jgi:23S rRNA (guanosine2251-2'-O)-methyltransferase